MAREPRGIQSLEAAGRLLLALSRHPGPMSLKDLAQAAEMSPSTAHPYLVSWRQLGLIAQDSATGLYDLGEQSLLLGLQAIQRMNPVKTAVEALRDFDPAARCSLAISVWGNLGPTIVHVIEADYPLHVILRTGTVLSLAHTAAGNVFAAFMPKVMVSAALPLERHRFAGAATSIAYAALEPMIARVRAAGWAANANLAVPGVNSVCAPVFDADGKIALAVSVMRPGPPEEAAPAGPITALAVDCAARISARLGRR